MTAALHVLLAAVLYVAAALLFAVGTAVLISVRQGIRRHRAERGTR